MCSLPTSRSTWVTRTQMVISRRLWPAALQKPQLSTVAFSLLCGHTVCHDYQLGLAFPAPALRCSCFSWSVLFHSFLHPWRYCTGPWIRNISENWAYYFSWFASGSFHISYLLKIIFIKKNLILVKYTLSIFKFSCVKYIYSVVQLLLFVCRIFHPQIETLYPFNNDSLFPLPLVPSNHHSACPWIWLL